MANESITQLPANTNPGGQCIVPIVDPANTSGASTGTNEQATLTNLFASQNVVKIGGDLAGSTAAPTVAKIQGTSIAGPSGGSTHFLNAAGTWTIPAGGGGGGGSVVDWVSVITYGADPSGVADSTTAFTEAIGALPTAGGLVYAPAGQYKISSTLTFKQNQGMLGDGHSTTVLNYTGSGICVKSALSGTFDGSAEGGYFSGWQVNGYGGGSGAIGMEVVDLQGVGGHDISFYGCATAGLYMNTNTGWSEECQFTKIACIQCGTTSNNATGAAIFNGTSFDYGVFEFTIVSNPGAHGVVLSGGTNMNGCRLAIRGDFYANTPNTAGVIAIDPGNTSGTSYMITADLDVSVETAGSGTGHYIVNMGSNNATSQFGGSGILAVFPATVNSQGILNNGFLPFGFTGVLLYADTHGNYSMSAGDGLGIYGGVVEQWNGQLANALGGTVYTQFGNKWLFQLASGSNSLAFDGLGALGKEIDLFIQQPSSGSAGSVTWPGAVNWGTTGAPTLTATNSKVDWIRLMYVPPNAIGNSSGAIAAVTVAKGFTL